MDVKAKAAQPIGGYFSGSFDAKLRAAVNRVKGISMLEKIKLINAINDACLQAGYTVRITAEKDAKGKSSTVVEFWEE